MKTLVRHSKMAKHFWILSTLNGDKNKEQSQEAYCEAVTYLQRSNKPYGSVQGAYARERSGCTQLTQQKNASNENAYLHTINKTVVTISELRPYHQKCHAKGVW